MICPKCGGRIEMDASDINGVCDTCSTRVEAGQLIEEENRSVTLLKAAKDMLMQYKMRGTFQDYCPTVHYDDADCDAYCLIDDIEAYLDEIGAC